MCHWSGVTVTCQRHDLGGVFLKVSDPRSLASVTETYLEPCRRLRLELKLDEEGKTFLTIDAQLSD